MLRRSIFYSSARLCILALAVVAPLASARQTPRSSSPAAWYDPAWSFRKSINVDNSLNSAILTDYQLEISLDRTNFDFGKALADGSDLRVTDSDGTTLIPYTITSYDSGQQQGTLWVKMPTIPASSAKIIYLYYGNPGPQVFDVPPIGTFQKLENNPIVSRPGLLAENVTYDPVTKLYWMVYSDFNASSSDYVGASYSTDMLHWTVYGPIFTTSSQQSPHLLLYKGTWYLYYGSANGSNVEIAVATAPNVTGPFTPSATPMISPTPGTWESKRVMEPYVFLDENGTWYMFYMGDSGDSTEQVGYATAGSPIGPWIKYARNPAISFGAPGSYDASTVADPFVYKFNGTYYIFYSAGATKLKPWQEAYATTTDMFEFTKHNIVLGRGGEGAWDGNDAHRGALIRVGDKYFLSYTGYDGSAYRIGMAVASATSTNKGFPPEQVFDFYDDFSSPMLSSHFVSSGTAAGFLTSSNNAPIAFVGSHPRLKWLIALVPVFGFVLATVKPITMRSNKALLSAVLVFSIGATCILILASCGGKGTSRINGERKDLSRWNQLASVQQFGPGHILEVYSRHLQADGSGNHLGQLGFTDISGADKLAVRDYDTPEWQKLSFAGGAGQVDSMAQSVDKDWHLQRIWWIDSSSAKYQNDQNSWEIENNNIPTATLPVTIRSCATSGSYNDVQVGWIRVRQYTQPEPTVIVSAE